MNTTPTIAVVPLPGLPLKPLTAHQQMEALRRVEAQVQARTAISPTIATAVACPPEHESLLHQVRTLQENFRAKLLTELAACLKAHAAAVRPTPNLTPRIEAIERSFNDLLNEWKYQQVKVASLIRRVEALVENVTDYGRYAAVHTFGRIQPQPVTSIEPGRIDTQAAADRSASPTPPEPSEPPEPPKSVAFTESPKFTESTEPADILDSAEDAEPPVPIIEPAPPVSYTHLLDILQRCRDLSNAA